MKLKTEKYKVFALCCPGWTNIEPVGGGFESVSK
jgi:hypothetical protein